MQIYWNKRKRLHKKRDQLPRVGLGHQHIRHFIVLGHQYGRRDVMWKHSIQWKPRALWLFVTYDLLEYWYMNNVTENFFPLLCSTFATLENTITIFMSPLPPFPPPPKNDNKNNLHNHCFQFLLGLRILPREIENNGYAQSFLGKDYHGIF